MENEGKNIPNKPEPVADDDVTVVNAVDTEGVIEAVAVEEPDAENDDVTIIAVKSDESVDVTPAGPEVPVVPEVSAANGGADRYHPRKKSIFRRLIPLYITLGILAALGAVGYFVVWPYLQDNKAAKNTLQTPSGSEDEDDEELSEEARRLKEALENEDYDTVAKLADGGYAEAFYPLAVHCLEMRDYEAATDWAERSIDCKLHVRECYDLLEQIDHDKAEDDKAERLVAALDSDDYAEVVRLAIEGYVNAYYYAAYYYFEIRNYESATLWAERSIEEGVNVEECRTLLEMIEERRNGADDEDVFDTPVHPYGTPEGQESQPFNTGRNEVETPVYDGGGNDADGGDSSSDNVGNAYRNYTEQEQERIRNTAQTAYGIQAEALFKRGVYDKAHEFAIKALRSGKDTDRARRVIQKLIGIDYYYDREANRRDAARLCPDLF